MKSATHLRRLTAAWNLIPAILLFFVARPAPARQVQLLDSGWRFHLNEVDGNSSIAPPGLPLTRWVWIADDSATNDAGTMASPGLDTSTWTNFSIGTDVFNGRLGYAWFRSTIVASKLPYRPAAIYFSGVDDNAWVYLNGVLVGQHAGWSQPFAVSSFGSAWIDGGTNVLAVAVQNTGGIGGIYAPVLLQSPSPQVQPPGVAVTRWLWLADSQAPGDSATMAATNLDASAWQPAIIGESVLNGPAWFRATLDGLVSSGRPLTLHFVSVDGSASIYLNGVLLGRHAGSSQPFDLSVPNSAWAPAGPNILSVAAQNSNGSVGLAGPVIIQCANQVPPPGLPVDQWVWLADSNAPADAGAMAATNLNTSAWATVPPGRDLFQNNPGAIWMRASLDAFATGGRPLTLHFLDLGSNVVATVYLNGNPLGRYGGAFDLSLPANDWAAGGPNILAVALQNSGSPGGLLEPVLLQSGEDIQDFSPADPGFDDSAWRTVHLPHDYIVEGSFSSAAETSHASLPLANAWYRLKFPVSASAQDQSAWIDFDGVYHNSMVWLNGHYLGYWYSGYAPFRYDVSRFLLPGATNVLAVHVDPHGDEGWWYEGAGIYRHVWLTIANPVHIEPWGTFVTSAVQGEPDSNGDAPAVLTVTTTLTNATSQAQTCNLLSEAMGPDGFAAGQAADQVIIPAGQGTNVSQSIVVPKAQLWSLERPRLYQLQSSILQNGQAVDACETPFGIRSIRFDVSKGFFLNGRHVEIQGMCNHQDFAGTGIAIPDNLLYWRIMKLKQMGANAYRCSHNPPTQALLDACDRLGMLVMDENRHLGDATGAYSSATAQTTYADLSPLSNMILRDRNHPSIILWSMCNEEAISGTQAGADIFYAMKKRVQQFDTSRPITCAMNSGWFNIGISQVEDVEGFNYSPGQYDAFHQEFPSQPMFGSETASAVTDRGVYTNDGVAYVSAYTTTPENAWQPVATRPFMAGAFIWTGFDYKGEPSPYGWPCISSKFGAMDLCGLPKDSYYYYQAWWRDQPLVHILPHWNWSNGQTITVWCYANTASVELFLNGVSQGAQAMPAYGHLAWSVPYSPGTLLAKGYDALGNVVATDQVETAGSPAAIRLTTDRTHVIADGEDATVVYASILDAQGRVVPTASNLVSFAVQGAGYVEGVGNGDPASHEPDKASQRSAFNGWCMALAAATNGAAGTLTLTASSPGLTPASLNIEAAAPTDPPAAPAGLSAEAGNGQVALRWDLSFGASSYIIERSTAIGGPYETIATYTATSYTDFGLTNGTTYFYLVSAASSHGQSPNSNPVSATPTAPPAPPAPTGLTAEPAGGQVALSWNGSVAATEYNVKRSTNGSGPFATVATTVSSNYVDAGLINGTTYYYVVSALNSGGESPDSSVVSAIPGLPAPIVWFKADAISGLAGGSRVTDWIDSSGHGNDATNGVSIQCPVYVAGALNGLPVVRFDAAASNFLAFARPIQDDFTIVCVFRTTGGVGAGTQFWQGAGLVNGEVNGPADDFGTCINANGQVIGGVGNLASSDTSVASGGGFNDGAPHVLTFTRVRNTGAMALYVDGALAGTAAGSLNSLTAPPRLVLGAQQTLLNYFSGDIAEIRIFASALTDQDRQSIETQLKTMYGISNTPAASPPAAPSGLAATAGDREVALSWNGSAGAANYRLKRSLVSGGPYTLIASPVATIAMDSGLGAGTYFYVVSATNAAGESPDSPEVKAVVACPDPPAPAGLAATDQQQGILLDWLPVSTGTSPTTYSVWRATNSAGPYALLAVGLTATHYLDATRLPGTTCYYLVQAANACGGGPVSAPLAINSVPAPRLAEGLANGRLVLSWPSWAGDYAACSVTNLTPPLSWQPLTNALVNSNGVLELNVPPTTGTRFYRLILQ